MFNMHTLRALKGAPLSIVVAMLMARQPVGESWLMSMTGYSQNTIRNGCKFLVESQMIQRNGRYESYVLSDGTLQLPMVVQASPESQKMTLPEHTTTASLNKKEMDNSEEKAVEEEHRASKNDSRLVLLYSAGIMEPTASRLLEKKWITNEYIDAHVKKAQDEDTPIPLLIHRMMSHDPMPKKVFDGSPDAYRRSWMRDRNFN